MRRTNYNGKFLTSISPSFSLLHWEGCYSGIKAGVDQNYSYTVSRVWVNLNTDEFPFPFPISNLKPGINPKKTMYTLFFYIRNNKFQGAQFFNHYERSSICSYCILSYSLVWRSTQPHDTVFTNFTLYSLILFFGQIWALCSYKIILIKKARYLFYHAW